MSFCFARRTVAEKEGRGETTWDVLLKGRRLSASGERWARADERHQAPWPRSPPHPPNLLPYGGEDPATTRAERHGSMLSFIPTIVHPFQEQVYPRFLAYPPRTPARSSKPPTLHTLSVRAQLRRPATHCRTLRHSRTAHQLILFTVDYRVLPLVEGMRQDGEGYRVYVSPVR